MSEDTTGFVELPQPRQCVLWNEPHRVRGRFKEVESYEDSSHLTRSLFECNECGQLYFHEWYEWVDWEGGADKHYTTLIPVQTREQIEALRATDIFGLLSYFPRLQSSGGTYVWIGKDEASDSKA